MDNQEVPVMPEDNEKAAQEQAPVPSENRVTVREADAAAVLGRSRDTGYVQRLFEVNTRSQIVGRGIVDLSCRPRTVE
jgi:hypothetical protein